MSSDSFDFFISYNHNDLKWANWINDVLIRSGYRTLFQERDCPAGSNFVGFMHQALNRSKRTLGVLSPNALQSDFVQLEWQNTIAGDVTGAEAKLLLVRVANCMPDGIYRRIGFLDLIGVLDEQLEQVLLEGVQPSINSKSDSGLAPEPISPESLKTAGIERVLKTFADHQQTEWMLERHSPDREHALLYYVPPHLGWYEPKTNGQTEYQRIEGETEDDRLVALMRIGKWLRIAEDPGVGKSVFTKRLRAFLSGEKAQQEFFGGKPPLVVLWEETDGTWPKTDFVTALDNALSGFCQTEPSCDPCDVRQYALERERVVIILDAMDQVGDAKHIQAILSRLREFLSAEGKHCRVILTGRPLIMNANSSKLPHLSDWKLAHIEEFDLRQQYQYLYGPTEAELQELFGEDAANTLRVMTPDQQDELDLEDDSTPIVYRLVEEVDATDDDEIQNVLRQRFPHFDAVSDLLTTPHNLFLIRRLAQENGGLIPPFETRADIYWQTCEASIRRALSRLSADEHLAVDVEETTARLQAILAAIACEMMVQAPERHDVQGSQEITQLRQVAGRRIENGTITDQDWRLLQQVTPITRRGIIRELETAELRWHHPRMMQFFCGLHLARNSQPDWEREPSRYNEKTDEYELDAIACGDRRATPQSRSVRDHAANPLWEEAFRFAMEIPATVRDPSILRSSLSLLFEAPKPRLGFVRPSQLIWEAWQLFEPEDGSSTILQGAEVIRRQFQQPYENMLTGKGTPEQQQIADVFEQGFVLCPPSKENLSPEGVYQFTMGTTGIIRKEAAVEVELSPFLMQQFPVTREQYALYDPRHDQAHQADMDKYSSEPCCPVIDVTWWDAWCFAMFTGKVLPSEAQWECACRAGTTTPFAFGKELTQEQANFKRMVGHTTPQGTYPPPTEWKLYDMHGNVWEWCQDWFHDKLPGGRNPVILERASIRVYRGGSWRHSAGRLPVGVPRLVLAGAPVQQPGFPGGRSSG